MRLLNDGGEKGRSGAFDDIRAAAIFRLELQLPIASPSNVVEDANVDCPSLIR